MKSPTLLSCYLLYLSVSRSVIKSKPFPAISDNQKLVADDFKRFSQTFRHILLRKVPTAQNVRFIFNEEELKTLFGKGESVDDLVALFRSVSNRSVEGRGIYHDYLMIPFDLTEETTVVALFSRVDPLFNKRVGDDWLSDVRNEVRDHFLLLKQARIDDQTGLFNSSNLYSILDNPLATQPVQLLVVEIPARSGSFQLVASHLHKCVLSLQTCIPEGAIIHYLGNFVFAVLIEFQSENNKSKLANSLIAYFKREGFSRIHVGTSCRGRIDSDYVSGKTGRQLIDEAWTASRVATKRGPFSYCDFGLFAHPEKHPLVRPDSNLIRRLRRLWQESEHFCLVHFRSDDAGYSADQIVRPHLKKGTIVASETDLLVYFEGDSRDTILEWTENIVRHCRDIDGNKTVSAGVSCFPYSDFKKSEIPHNCLKALAHAAFFGDAGVALFDAVSLNISGDIYFSDGDLVKAVKEYKRGLKCDKINVNLHNSLGVTLALMGRFASAENCFEEALKLDEKSFMALYNLGLGELDSDRKVKAIAYFKRALACVVEEGMDESVLENDLKRQIGILASETGDCQMALDYLLPWHQTCEVTRLAEGVAYYIGKSYFALCQPMKAMEWLQRALRSYEYDDRAMHLLGQVYFEEEEGDDIALSLCQKSAELDPDNCVYRLDLAKIQLHCNMLPEAIGNLKQSLKSLELRTESQLFLAQSYLKIGQHKRALNWFNKVKSVNGANSDLYDNLKLCLTG